MIASSSGILIVDKISGVTSFDGVALARKRLGVRRVGHAGTLDPAATGVLPLLVGEATKLAPYLMDQDKEYVATLRFGVTTDTHDLAGRVLSERPVTGLTRSRLDLACRAFVGLIRQVPPMYSAVHHAGRRLYELAREGREVDRSPREVVVSHIEVQRVEQTTATLRIVCGKGTYVRALAADLGIALGCGAAVERLVRMRVGRFTLDDAVAWRDLVEMPTATLWTCVSPPDAALAHLPAVRLDAGGARRFVHGQPADVRPPLAVTGPARVYDGSDVLLGVGEIAPNGAGVRPVRMVHADRSGPSVRPA
jgi:tRNA pseudouridine55 synthase